MPRLTTAQRNTIKNPAIGLPFKPSQIKFTAYSNGETYNLNSDIGVGNNNNTFENVFGSMSGYATNYSGAIAQQLIFNGGC